MYILFLTDENEQSNFFSFSRLLDLSPEDIYQLTIGGLLSR